MELFALATVSISIVLAYRAYLIFRAIVDGGDRDY